MPRHRSGLIVWQPRSNGVIDPRQIRLFNTMVDIHNPNTDMLCNIFSTAYRRGYHPDLWQRLMSALHLR
jgi:hypothetical protein